jgi:hypothetical protein
MCCPPADFLPLEMLLWKIGLSLSPLSQIQVLMDDWEARKDGLEKLEEKPTSFGMGSLTEEEIMEFRLLKKTTNILHDPRYCAEPEIFLPMREKCDDKTSQTKHLSVFAMSAEIVGGQIRVKITSCLSQREP